MLFTTPWLKIRHFFFFFIAGFTYLDSCVFRSRFTVLTACFIFGDVFWRFIAKHTFWETLSNKFKKKKTWTLRVLIKMLMSLERKKYVYPFQNPVRMKCFYVRAFLFTLYTRLAIIFFVIPFILTTNVFRTCESTFAFPPFCCILMYLSVHMSNGIVSLRVCSIFLGTLIRAGFINYSSYEHISLNAEKFERSLRSIM